MTTLALAVGRAGGAGVSATWPEEALAERTAQVLAPVLRHDESAVVSEDVLLVRLGRRLPARRRTAELLSHLHDQLPGRDVVIGAGLSPGRRGVRRAGRLARSSLRGGDQTVLPDLAARRRPVGAHRPTTVLQVLAASVLTFLVPLAALGALGALGLDAAGAVLGVTAAAVLVMAVLVWAEALASLPRLPARRDVQPAPTATALVVAYLPNEVDTVVGAVRSALAQDYPGELQVVLAYNSPVVLPVERELAEIARADDRLTLLRVEGSTSKAENVNAALAVVRGEFVGLFDADHRPTPTAFRRAWRRLSDGADVVQGRCAVRNGGQSAIARLVACEFEQIYGVSHPGRQRVHGFGVFGGSNGYWRTAVLRRVRLRTSYLTEDIESSIRAVRDGVRIVNDPAIVSLELAPTTLPALWAQRLRWSQGWFQVSMRHLHGVATSPRLGLRQRLGMVLLLGWREAYPWLSALVLPALVHLALQGRLDDVGVVGLLALVFSWSTTPLLALLTWSRSLPHVRRRWSWWIGYLLLSPLYAELRNLIMRVAVLKELRGERRWVVTPRGATTVRPRVLGVRRPAPATSPAPVATGEPASVVPVV